MKSRSLFLLVFTSCALLVAHSVEVAFQTGNAQKDTFAPASDVRLIISTERNTYKAGEPITIKYKVTNISNARLYVPREWEAKCPAAPHLWAWFEDGSGRHFVPGYAGSCSPTTNPKTLTERMSKEAVLLKPGEHLEGTLRLETKLFGGLRPGPYRIEAVLTGWAEEKFSDAERSELAGLGSPFLRGEVPSSTNITLAPKQEQ